MNPEHLEFEDILRQWGTTMHKENRILPTKPQPPQEPSAPIDLSGRTIPKAYAWASREAPELAQRITGVDPLGVLDEVAGLPRVVFAGPAGAGKTSLACAALREEQRRGNRWARFEHAYRLATVRAITPLGGGEAPLIERAISAPLLLIDDLGTERKTELSAVCDVIFERHAQDLPTWVTTAFSAGEIATRYGDGIARRIFENAKLVTLGRDKGKVAS